MKMNVDIFAQKFVDSMDDDSSLADIFCGSIPINLLKLKSLMTMPMITLGFTILKLISPLNWSRYISAFDGIGIVKIVKKVQSYMQKNVAAIYPLYFLAKI